MKNKTIVGMAKDLAEELLSKCTQKQKSFFQRMYPKGIEAMTASQLDTALDQLENTIKKNETKGD